MSIEQKLENGVEKVLKTNTVSGATKVLRSKAAVGIVFTISFLESALPLPLLTDPFIVAAILAEKKNAIKLVAYSTMASVMGGVFAYLIASFFLEFLMGLISSDLVEQFHHIVHTSNSGEFILTLVGAVTPIPYTLVAWAVAALEGSLMVFIAASVIGRGFRYSVVGYCTYKFGFLAIDYAKKYMGLASIVVFLLAGLFVWLKM